MRNFTLVLFAFFALALVACDDSNQSSSGSVTPSTAEVTDTMRDAIQDFNEEGMSSRQAAGESFIPVPVGSSNASLGMFNMPSERVVDRSKLGNRRIAETHTLTIEILHDDLSDRYDRDFEKCIALGCEIQNSNMNNRSNGYILARIIPENLGAYLDFVATGSGEVKSHAVNTQDKTLAYIDTEAKIKNAEELRERLLNLLNAADTVDNVIRIESELARVEQQLDSAKGSLRHLQTLTDMATVRVNYQVPYQDIQIKYNNLEHTLMVAWQEFLNSVSYAVTFIGAVLPWLPIIGAGIWMFIAVIRFALRKRPKTDKKPEKSVPSESDVDKSQ